MERRNSVKPNSQEFVVLSVDGFKKLAKIDESGENLYWTTDINKEIPVKVRLNAKDLSDVEVIYLQFLC